MYRVTLRGTGGGALANLNAATLGKDVSWEFTVWGRNDRELRMRFGFLLALVCFAACAAHAEPYIAVEMDSNARSAT